MKIPLLYYVNLVMYHAKVVLAQPIVIVQVAIQIRTEY